MIYSAICAADPNRISFPKLGLELTVRSTAFTLFGFSVTWYGVLITVGMMLAMFYAFRRMRSFGLDADRALDGIIGGVIGGIIGARLYYVIFHWESYSGDWKTIFNIRNGGLAIYGGIIGALIVGSVVCKLRKVRLLPMYDIVSLGFLIGQCIGRWGNFMNHEAFGCNTDSIFGMTSGKIQSWIERNYADGSLVSTQPVHPCFFYESMWCLLGFILLHIISKKWRKFDGQIFLMYVIWYGTGRFFIEGLRTDSLYAGTLKISQVVAVISVVTALVLLLIGFGRAKRLGTDYQLYYETEESKQLLAESDAREQEWQEKHSKKPITPDEESTHVLIPEEDAAVKAEKDAKVDAILDELKEKAESAAEQASDTVKDAAENAAEAAADTVKDAAEDAAEAAADTVKDAAEAIADAADQAAE
ncbi:MAG: prolipoprotein diacylglyceryl transferase [Oscillospiraceae bacterium]|nr:prolipoprotein diacylglyceryl transferase [Oscillospiraceae bacterium]